jgi:hypothetical protein
MGLAPDSLKGGAHQQLASLATVTAFTSNVCQCIYLGRQDRPLTSIDIIVNVTTAYIAGAWAEVAIYYGAPSSGVAPGTLTRLGSVSVAAIFNGTGIKKATVALSAMPPEAELWCVLGSNTGTQFQLRGCLADEAQTGAFCTFTGRPSTSATIAPPTIGGAAAVPAFIAGQFVVIA